MPSFSLTRTSPKQNLRSSILDDPRIKKLIKAKENGSYSIDTQELVNELIDMQTARHYSSMRMKEFIPSMQNNLVKWQLELNTTRSRVVTIRMNCFNLKQDLSGKIKDARNYILTTWTQELKNEVGSQITIRKQYVDQILSPFIRLESKLDTVIELATILAADLSESRWNAYGVVETMKIQVGRD